MKKQNNQSDCLIPVGSVAWLENEQLVEQMIKNEEEDNLFLKNNIRSFSKLFKFLYNHPLMRDGYISGIHIDEISNACHLERTMTLKMLELLKATRFMVYTATDDAYEIGLGHLHAWKSIDACDDSAKREHGIYFYVSW